MRRLAVYNRHKVYHIVRVGKKIGKDEDRTGLQSFCHHRVNLGHKTCDEIIFERGALYSWEVCNDCFKNSLKLRGILDEDVWKPPPRATL